LPSEIGFVSLGRHQLAGLAKAEEIYQLQTEGLLTDFPPLRSGAVSAAGAFQSSEG
jgi:hypothetical protein